MSDPWPTAQLLDESQVILVVRRATTGWPVAQASGGIRRLGLDPEALGREGRSWAALVHPDDLDRVAAAFIAEAAGGSDDLSLEYRLLGSGGEVVRVDERTHVRRDAEGRPTELVGVLWRVADRPGERERRRTEDFHEAILEGINEGIWVTDREGRVAYVNSAMCRLAGTPREELLGRRFPEDFDEDEAPEALRAGVAEARATLRPQRYDGVLIITPSGRGLYLSGWVIPLIGDGVFDGLILTAVDVTERRQLENQLRHSVKMQAMGRLAGGVAHDFNNLLTALLGHNEMLLDQVEDDSPLRHGLEEMSRITRRATSLSRQLLLFSRRQAIEPRIVNLNAVVADVELLLRRVLGEDIDILLRLDPGLGTTRVDPDEVAQTLVNLAINARDAMPQGGRLVLETANVVLDADYARAHQDVAPGPYVMVAVVDTGHGMTREVRERVFEPFFSTKEGSKGSGLGLPTVHSIIRQSGGHIFLYSDPGQGTAVRIYLPLVAEASDVTAPRPAAARSGGTVLLVEDDDEVRDVVSRALSGSGYRVIDAGRGDEAIRRCREIEGEVDVLVTDVVMPGMSGRELAGEVQRRRPGVKILYISGYSTDTIFERGILDEGMEFLQKPFSLELLLQKVGDLVGAPGR